MRAVVVALDRLAGRLIGCCGAEQARTPAFDRLAADGLLFPLCFADDLTDHPASHAWWTGTRQLLRHQTGLEPAVQLAPALSARGVSLHLLSDPRSRVPVPHGALWTRLTPEPSPHDTPAAGAAEHQLSDQVQAAVSLLSQPDQPNPEAPQLIWIQSAGCADSPDTQNSPDPAASSVARLQAEVELLDRALLPLVEWFTAVGSSQPAAASPPLLLVTADQGVPVPLPSECGDHTAPRPLRSDVVQTPLFLLVPGRWQNCRSLEFQQPMDVLPTLLEWFDVPFDPARLEGRSLLESARATELAAGEQPAARPFRQVACTGHSGRNLAGIRTSRFYFTASLQPVPSGAQDGPPADPPAAAFSETEEPPADFDSATDSSTVETARLFGKPEDQWDLHDLSREHLDLAEHFESGLKAFCDRLPHQLPAPDPADMLPPELLQDEASSHQYTSEE